MQPNVDRVDASQSPFEAAAGFPEARPGPDKSEYPWCSSCYRLPA